MNDIDEPKASRPAVPPEPRRSWAARMASRPLSRTFLALFLLAAALLLYQRSAPFPRISLGLDGLVFIAVPLLLVVWLARFAGFIIVGATGPPGLSGLRRSWLRWSLPLLITVGVSVLGALDAPFRVRFALSRAAMDRNGNGQPDGCDLHDGSSQDLNANGIPDECEAPGDVDGDGTVGFLDLLLVLSLWGSCQEPCPPACQADLDMDCAVGFSDLVMVLSNWG